MQNLIEYEKSGAGDSFVLLHGWGMNTKVLAPLAKELSAKYEVFNVALPGYGEGRWSTDLSLDDQAKIIGDQLPAGKILGWSLGGLLAISLVKHFPGKFDPVIVCCNPCFVRRPDFESGIDEYVFDQFADELKKNWALTMRRFLALQMLGVEGAKQTVKELMKTMLSSPKPDSELLNKGLQLIKEADLRRDLQAITTPFRWILGERDTLVPHRVSADILLLNPLFNVECVAAAGHAPFLSHPDEFLALL